MDDFYQEKDFLSERQDFNNCSIDWIFCLQERGPYGVTATLLVLS